MLAEQIFSTQRVAKNLRGFNEEGCLIQNILKTGAESFSVSSARFRDALAIATKGHTWVDIHIHSSYNGRGQVRHFLSGHLVKVSWERCFKVTIGTWSLKASTTTLTGKQATRLRQLFSQGTKGVEVVVIAALCPTSACEPAKGNWAPNSGSLCCSLISSGEAAEAGGGGSQGSPWSPICWSVPANVSQLCCWAAVCGSSTRWEAGQPVALVPLRAPFQAAQSGAAIKRSAKMVQEKDTAQGVKKKAENGNPLGTQPRQVLSIAEGANHNIKIKGWAKSWISKPMFTKMLWEGKAASADLQYMVWQQNPFPKI